MPHIRPWEQWHTEQERRHQARMGFTLAVSGAAALPLLFAGWAYGGGSRTLPLVGAAIPAAVAAAVVGLALQERAAPEPARRAACAGPRWSSACVVAGATELTAAVLLDGRAAVLTLLLLPSTVVVGRALALRQAPAPHAHSGPEERWQRMPLPNVDRHRRPHAG